MKRLNADYMKKKKTKVGSLRSFETWFSYIQPKTLQVAIL